MKVYCSITIFTANIRTYSLSANSVDPDQTAPKE